MTHTAKIIAFAHHKGGTGKTTACLNTAGWLAKMGKSVLVIDLDPQGNSTAGLGVDRSTVDGSLYEVLRGEKNFQNVILETASGVHVAPSSLDLIAAEMDMAGRADQVGVLDERLKAIATFYDYILIDIPPGPTQLMMNGIAAAEDLIIPIDSGVFGCEALETFKAIIMTLSSTLGVRINLSMVLIKSFSSNVLDWKLSHDVSAMVKTFLQTNDLAHVIVTSIPFSRKVYGAQMKGLPISHYAPHSSVGRVYKGIAREVINGHHGDGATVLEGKLKSATTRSL